MRGRVLRSVMAHEIAHHVLGHHPTDALILRARQEAAAQRWAAHRLIRTEEYVATERERDGHVPSMAVDLQVADELVTAYQRDVVRLGDTVYVRPGLGVGDWLYREEVA
jgi:Zn-dependent protease with chaperone function